MEENRIQWQIIRSSRRTLSVEPVSRNLVRVRCPVGLPDRILRDILRREAPRVLERLRQLPPALPLLTEAEKQALVRRAESVFPARTAYFASRMGVTWGKLSFRFQRTLWGSCTGKGNLSFNCLLLLAPEEVLDYVVVHELCHRREMNHSPRFWALVEAVLPDWRSRRQWLREQGSALLSRLPP